MSLLSVENLAKSYGLEPLFTNLTFGLQAGEKVALIGRNGTGKSTLLKIIAGLVPMDKGTVALNKDAKVVYVGQQDNLHPEDTILEAAFSDKEDPAVQAVKRYEALIHGDDTAEDYVDALQEAITAMDQYQAWDLESKAASILGKLGINDFQQKVSSLSGGMRKRVSLAAALIRQADLLILDEPTNHLDLESIEWLEEYLNKDNLSLILVTHDRYFMDKVCNRIIELDQGKVYKYEGNYAYYLEKKAEREQLEAVELQKNRNLFKKELEWMRRQPKARTTKARYRIDAFDDLSGKVKGKKETAELDLRVGMERLGKKIVEAQHLSKSFGDNEVLRPFSYVFQRGERLGLIGPNGSGKSTFLKLITGELPSDTGALDVGSTIRFGYFRQQEDRFNEHERVIDHVKAKAEVITTGDGQSLSPGKFLELFQFSPQKQYTPIGKLSGGEKKRLQLLDILVQDPNFLILDEPTNDLDLPTLQILEEFLAQYQGCLIVVSHDRYFMDRLVDHLFVFDGEGSFKDFPGNYTEYRYQEEEKQPLSAPAIPKTGKTEKQVQSPVQTPVSKAKLSYKEQREKEGLEKDIAALEQEKGELEEILAGGTAELETITKASARIAEIQKALEEKELRWLELEDRDA
jgi:ABC transport system ATP-binding/permease protein